MTPLTHTAEELAPKRPKSPEWRRVPNATSFDHTSTWRRGGDVLVISTLGDMELPRGNGKIGPQWLVSISMGGGRAPDAITNAVLAAFDLVGAEEDNHHPGISRAFFMPVDPAYRLICDCKITENTIVEEDGFRWTNPNDGSGCRGCEYEQLTGTPCSVHQTLRLKSGKRSLKRRRRRVIATVTL